MYTDEDLDFAVKKEIFSAASVKEFREALSVLKNSPSADEENFRLIGGFNDIFIVIACSLLLFSSLWVLHSITDNDSLGLLVFSILSWLLSEHFVLKRKMALPAIGLLLSFIGGVFALVFSVFADPSETALILATSISAIAAYVHWIRFSVPITIAAGAAAVVGFMVSIILSAFPNTKEWWEVILLLCGVMTFACAMYWDASDTRRTTRRSDVAFWLHLLSAPLIIHPVFSALGVLDGNEHISNMIIIVGLYVLMTSISIVIDRRAFMVSSLIYVLYALSILIKTYGGVGYSFALTGVFMGGALLFLSAYWHRVRVNLVNQLPATINRYIPEVIHS